MRGLNGVGLLAVVAVIGLFSVARANPATDAPARPQASPNEHTIRPAEDAAANDSSSSGRDASTKESEQAEKPKPDPCVQGLLEALLAACEQTEPKAAEGHGADDIDACIRAASPEILIATVPDPSELGSYYLEQSLEAMKLAVQNGGWLSHREYLPWFFTNGGDKSASRCEESVPGLVVFRRAERVAERAAASSSGARWLALLLVGESVRAGVNASAFERALELWRQTPRQSAELRLLAPTFSGTAESIADALGSWAALRFSDRKTRPAVRMISGTATDADLARRIDQRLASDGDLPALELEFDSAAVRDRYLTCAFYAYLEDSLGAHPGRVALLVEPGTQYGQSVRSTADQAPKVRCPTPEHVLEFPPHLPLVRAAHERRAQATPASKSVPGFDLPKATLDAPRTEPAHLPGLVMQISDKSLAAEDLALSHLLRDIVRQGVEYVGIVATDTADTIFLARIMRQSAPDVRLFTFGGDALLVHPDHSLLLGGMLTITSFPLSSAADRLIDSGRRDQGAGALIGDYARGVHQAMHSLLSGGRLGPLRPVWIHAIGNGGAWPVSWRVVEQPSADARRKSNGAGHALGPLDPPAPTCPPVSDPAAWKALFILLFLLGLYHGARCLPLPRVLRSALETRVLPALPPLVRPLSYFGQRVPARPAEHVEENQLMFVAFVGFAALTGAMSALATASCFWACGATLLNVFNGVLVGSGALATLVLSACALSAWKEAVVYLFIPRKSFAAPGRWEGPDGAALTPLRRRGIVTFQYGLSLGALAIAVFEAWLLYRFLFHVRIAWLVAPALVTAGALVLAVPIEVAVTRRWTASWQRVFSLTSAIFAAWSVLAAISTLRDHGLLGGEPYRALLTYERWTGLNSGLSPILPGIAAVLFLYVWCLGNLLRLEGAHLLSELARRVRAGIDTAPPESEKTADAARPVTGGPISAILDTNIDAGIRAHEEAVLDALRAAPSTGIVLKIGLIGMTVAITVLWFVQLRMQPVLTLEGPGANAVFNVVLLSYIVALGTTLFALFIYAHRLSKLLLRLARHPLAPAYADCPPSLSGNLALQLTAGVVRLDDLHLHVELLRRVPVELPSIEEHADRLELALSAERESLGVRNLPVWNSDSLVRLLHTGRVIWQKRVDTGSGEDSKNTPADILVASLTVLTVRELLRHFRYFVAVLTLGALLMLVMISSYAFQPRRFMSTLLWAVVIIVSMVCLVIYVRLDRDELLSRIGHSEPSRVTLNLPFVRWVLTWVVLPIGGAAALQYPELARAIRDWIVPFLH